MKMQDKLLRKTMVLGTLFFILAIGCMVYFNRYKVIYIQEIDTDYFMGGIASKQEGENPQLLLMEKESGDAELVIPLPLNIQTHHVQIQNQYTKRELWVYITYITEEFYLTEWIEADLNKVTQSAYELFNNGILLKFTLDNLYEFQSVIVDNTLEIQCLKPKTVYDEIIVIDVGNYEQNKAQVDRINDVEILTSIIEGIRSIFVRDNAKIYYAGLVEEESSTGVELANILDADFYIGIALNEHDDESVYGLDISYNKDYFLPSGGSMQLAHLLVTEVVRIVIGKANSINDDLGAYALLENASFPAMVLKIGYVSNEDELALLKEPSYQAKIGEGVVLAIEKIYDVLEGKVDSTS